MHVVTIPCGSVGPTIITPICSKIVEDVARVIEVNPDTINMLFTDLDVTKTDAKDNITIEDSPNLPTTSSKRSFSVKVDTKYNDDLLGTTAVNRSEYFPIFQDPTTALTVTPVYTKLDLTFDFTYKSPSVTEVENMRDKITLAFNRTRNIGHHEVEYTAIVPTMIEDLICDVHELRSRLIPQDLGEYFTQYSSNRVHPITDMLNEANVRLGVKERLVRVIGVYDFGPFPDEPNKNKEDNTTTLSFQYNMEISIPRFFQVRFPFMVCNRPIPMKYIEHIAETRNNNKLDKHVSRKHISKSHEAMSIMETNNLLPNTRDITLPITVPNFDTFDIRKCHVGYGVYMSVLVEVDETDRRTLFNLKELGEYQLATSFIKALEEGERFFVTKPYSSFVYIGLHQEGIYFDRDLLELTEDLTLRSTKELNLTVPVRVTLSIILDSSYLAPSTVKRLFDNKELGLDYIKTYLDFTSNFPEEFHKSSESKVVFVDQIAKYLIGLANRDEIELMKETIKTVVKSDKVIARELARYILSKTDMLLRYLNKSGVSVWDNEEPFDIPKDPNEVTVTTPGEESINVRYPGDAENPNIYVVPVDRGLVTWR